MLYTSVFFNELDDCQKVMNDQVAFIEGCLLTWLVLTKSSATFIGYHFGKYFADTVKALISL